jgi:putative glutamine amidotransferase
MLNEQGEMVTSNSKINSNIDHCKLDQDYVHDIILDKDSLLYKIIKQDRFKVNSRHTMEVKDTVMFKTFGKSEDGVIEEIEKKDQRFMIGVQWHPEILVHLGDENSLKLFKAFVEAAKETKI